MDDYTKCTWVYLLSSKAQVFSFFNNFIAYIHNHFHAFIKHLRSDNGMEFFHGAFTSLLHTIGITHESSCVHTLQQNGVVERKHKHLLDIARALRFQVFLPVEY